MEDDWPQDVLKFLVKKKFYYNCAELSRAISNCFISRKSFHKLKWIFKIILEPQLQVGIFIGSHKIVRALNPKKGDGTEKTAKNLYLMRGVYTSLLGMMDISRHT
eukprot:TRINITY_DN2726_c0_g1_i2.p1 TRINITY_DN2726_c0_g1~~TRINITY_DN2726_c0_g1_i2.p1  ORF type:complete len:121 (-),score=13.73 TRINITY_DN2726_c0_g1_i2:7-321(-)